MDTEAAPGRDPAPPKNPLAKVAGHLLGLISPRREGLVEFTDRLAAAFASGVVLSRPGAGTWFGTLEVISPEDNQVAARVRFSRSRPLEHQAPSRGMTDVEERGRELFAAPVPVATGAGEDLLLQYSFPLVFSVEKNLELFRTFASNELGRLRAPNPAASGPIEVVIGPPTGGRKVDVVIEPPTSGRKFAGKLYPRRKPDFPIAAMRYRLKKVLKPPKFLSGDDPQGEGSVKA